MQNTNGISTIVDRIFSPLVAPLGIPEPKKSVGILVGVTVAGQRYYFRFGQVDLHEGGTGSIDDTVVFIGSNTKVFTATLLALAASQTSAAQDTRVTDLLPSDIILKQPHGDILLWHLATHSAGFPTPVCGQRPAFGDYPLSSLGAFLNDFTPPYAPGRHWVYSNPGFALLGVLLSHAYAGGISAFNWDATYQNWPALVVGRVTAPLGMTSTQVKYSAVKAKVAQGYNYVPPTSLPPSYKAVEPPDWVLTSAGLGAGALSSTLADMLTFLEAEISPPEGHLGLAMRQTQKVHPPSNVLSMGLGWQLSNDYFDKNGGFEGYETYMAFDATHKVGVFVFGNTSGGAGDAITTSGRILLGELRGIAAMPSTFPTPDKVPHCP
ncbi:serine hydrolase domain-containing protein [Bradyrhizobium elkanii]|uniref:serine hydrolase domain-containing protein n=1 Tax=Bradyrhizobium elkanii TaxID=29448 RepID=UPI000425577C|nr:serine hydrolase domain-containing protein [Bradyrhizobium elkanii]